MSLSPHIQEPPQSRWQLLLLVRSRPEGGNPGEGVQGTQINYDSGLSPGVGGHRSLKCEALEAQPCIQLTTDAGNPLLKGSAQLRELQGD